MTQWWQFYIRARQNMSSYCNESNLNPLMRNNWRISLVPAAAAFVAIPSIPAAHYDFTFTAKHLPGKHNDARSRGKNEYFYPYIHRSTKSHSTTPVSRRAGHPAGLRLDIATLEAAVQQYFRAGLATSTSRVYESATL